MSILSQALKGQLTFAAASAQAAAWAQALVAHDPALTAASGALLSIVKQGASDAIMMADTAMGPLIQPAANGLEVALDAALASATKGLSVPFNPIMDSAIDQMAAVMKATADTWALSAKARLAAPPPAAPAKAS